MLMPIAFITTATAVVLGASLVAATGITAIAQSRQAKKQRQSQERIKSQEIDAQQKATAEVLAAPEKASERARIDSLNRRQRRAKTLLTSSTGVESETLKKKKLGE